MKLSRDHIIFGILGVVVLACLGAYLFFLRPEQSKIIQKVQDIQDQRLFLATLQKEQENLVTLSRDVNTVSKELNVLENIVLKTDNSLDFIAQLETYADTHHVEQSIALSQLSSSTEIQDVPLIITLKGPLPNVLSYMRTLEQSPYYIGVSSIELEPQPNDLVQAILRTHTFWIEKEL